MVFVSNLFAHPEKLDEVRQCMDILNYQIKMVEALEHGKQRLSNNASLFSGTLAHCLPFMQYVNKVDDFSDEVSKLSLNELMFAMINFSEKRLKTIHPLFKASDIKKYVDKQNINCLQRSEIFTRINHYLPQLDGNRFGNIYSNAKNSSESNIGLHEEDPEPQTGAKNSNGFKLQGVNREGMKNVFVENISNIARLTTVESRYPREDIGDAFIAFELESDQGRVAKLLDGWLEGDTSVAEITEAFGIATEIDQSDLRIWEKRKGRTETTSCVEIRKFYYVDLRICNNRAIANILHSQRNL